MAVFFENLNFYFMKTANIPMYGNIAVYIRYCADCLKNREHAKMLRILLFSIFTINTARALAALAPLGLLIVNTLTNVLLLFLVRFFTRHCSCKLHDIGTYIVIQRFDILSFHTNFHQYGIFDFKFASISLPITQVSIKGW